MRPIPSSDDQPTTHLTNRLSRVSASPSPTSNVDSSDNNLTTSVPLPTIRSFPRAVASRSNASTGVPELATRMGGEGGGGSEIPGDTLPLFHRRGAGGGASRASLLLRSPCFLLCLIGALCFVSLVIASSTGRYLSALEKLKWGSDYAGDLGAAKDVASPNHGVQPFKLLINRRWDNTTSVSKGEKEGDGRKVMEVMIDGSNLNRLLDVVRKKGGVEDSRLRGGLGGKEPEVQADKMVILNVDDKRLKVGRSLPPRSPQFEEGLKAAHSVFNDTHPRLKTDLEYKYIAYEKEFPYIGNENFTHLFENKDKLDGLLEQDDGSKTRAAYWTDKRKLLNSLAVFPSYEALHLPKPGNLSVAMHGAIGFDRSGHYVYDYPPMPPLAGDPRCNITEELSAGGGFYKNLSDALPLDRDVMDARDEFCLDEHFDLSALEDASVIITFYNEHISTLLRSVHSVLHRTPPPLLREIILVDDHSNTTDLMPGGIIYDLVAALPKVKLVRMPERRGIVMARIAGAKLASAPVLVILDSHIEVNPGWLEPQLQRLSESPHSIVMPQIDVLDSKHFNWTRSAGIGCWLGFKWVMQEQASLTIKLKNSYPIPSPSMGGGLFAVRADWFWELGGYDEGFEMWGAENVEMGFRVWMCGGRMECTPCARVYHIYRQGGVGYASPPLSLARNRMRTARVWMDEYGRLAEQFISPNKEYELGNIDRMLELKERLKCKPFQWFLNHIDPTNEVQSFNDIVTAGEIRNVEHSKTCVDTLAKADIGWQWGSYGCHGQLGTQGFLFTRAGRIILFMNDRRCLDGGVKKIDACEYVLKDHGRFDVRYMNGTTVANISASVEMGAEGYQIVWLPVNKGASEERCMTLRKENQALDIHFDKCINVKDASEDTAEAREQRWKLPDFKSTLKDYKPPEYSSEYLERKRKAESIHSKGKDEIIWKYGQKPDGTRVDQQILAD